MAESQIDKLISIKPNMFMVKYKDEQGRFSLRMEYPVNAETRDLSMEYKNKLLELRQKSSVEFLEELINWHLGSDKVIECLKGSSTLLPNNFQRFYDRCVLISTEKYQLYFNDKAIEKCSDIIFKLSERSKKDSFEFVKGKLQNGEAKHLYLSLSEWYNQSGRISSFDGEGEFNYSFFPNNTVGYSSYPKEDGTYDEDDINNILILIEEFTKAQGLFKYGKSNNTDLVMYNNGSMKIQGMDKDKRIDEKVMMLMKKER